MKRLYSIAITCLVLLSIVGVHAVVASSLLSGNAQSELDNQTQQFTESSGLNSQINFSEVVAQIIQVVLSFLGVILVVLIIYAGYLWMTAAGNEEKIGKAKNIIISAVIGLAIVLSAYAITTTVIYQVFKATRGGINQ